jgi:Tol biopolymer transport system component
MMKSLVHKRVLTVVMSLIAIPVTLPAQAEQDVPTIEPTYTRVFGSDTLNNIMWPAMSPDGRWIAFSVFEGNDRNNLWIVSADGGEPVRLTDGDHIDDAIVWFPTSDRIAFRSIYRLPYWAVMTLSIDRQSGRPVGPPRAVTLEGCPAYFDVSPDGQWIAYMADEQRHSVIRILPSSGGTARTLTRANTSFPLWGPDGRSIYYTLYGEGGERTFMRVPVAGGEPDTVVNQWGGIGFAPSSDSRYVLPQVSDDRHVHELTTLDGQTLARLTLPEGMEPFQLTADNQLLATKSNTFTPLRILPVEGGPAHRLSDASAHRYPLGWTRDGRIFFETKLNGEDILLLAPADGGAMHQVRIPEPRMADFAPVLSDDGEYLLYAVLQDDPMLSTLKVYSLEAGQSSILTRAHAHSALGSLLGRGGTPNRDGADFLYVENNGDVRELRASPPDGPSRLLWSFAAEQTPKVVASIHGDRIAFVRYLPAATLHLATVGDRESREVLRVPGALDEVVWSPDGKWIAVTHFDTSTTGRAGDNARIMFVQVSPAGELVGEPRFAGDKMLSWWNLRWLPDSRGILATGMDGNVWLLPLDPDATPVCLTRDDPNVSWNFVISPDGRYIAYHVLIPRGSSIWKVDLGEIPEPVRR